MSAGTIATSSRVPRRIPIWLAICHKPSLTQLHRAFAADPIDDDRKSARKPAIFSRGSGAATVSMSDLCGTMCGVKYRSANRCVYSAKYHVIWCPKYRRRVRRARDPDGDDA